MNILNRAPKQEHASVFTSGLYFEGDESKLDTQGQEYCRNVYVGLDGTVKPLPFNDDEDGIWHFDGQIFFKQDRRVKTGKW